MTTPKEEAIYLVERYVDLFRKSDTCFGDCKNTVACQQSWYQCEEWYRKAIQCALINVDEIWNALEFARVFEEYDYWQKVKEELKKL